MTSVAEPAAPPEPKPAVELPKGGGAIRGIGEKFTANPVTGAGSFTVPLGLPEARANLGLELALSYDSTAGNGPFGFGFFLEVPQVSRKTDKGVPVYGDDDVFLLSGKEDLVAQPGPDLTRAGYRVRRYQPRIEAEFARIERWTRVSDGDVHWRTISRENVLCLYGMGPGERVADPADPSRVHTWLLHSAFDDRGNAAWLSYLPEDESNVDLTAAHERNRTGRAANRYLKWVRYGNRKPLLLDTSIDGLRPAHLPLPDLAGAGWMFEVELDYGSVGGKWAVRADPFSRYRTGFEVRTYRLCRGFLVHHRFPDELGVDSYLTKALRLTYDEKPYGSFLREIVSCGYSRRSDGSYLERTLPPVKCDYTPFELGSEVSELAGALPAGYSLIDLDGEGIPGALHETAGAWWYQENLGGILGPAAALPGQPVVGRMRRFMDLAGDGNLDLVEVEPTAPGFYERTPEGGWEPLRAFDSWPQLSWADSRLADVTGDGLADLLAARDDHLIWHPSLGEAGFGGQSRIGLPGDEEGGPRLVFNDPDWSVHLADVSGDGLPDIVRIRNGEVCYWPNLGYGRFGAKVTMDNSPVFDAPDRFDGRRIRLGDIDGTGLTDIVYLGSDGVRLHTNEAGNSWASALWLEPLPGDAAPVHVTDILGRGTACLVWSTPAGPVRYLDLMSGRKPHLLTRVDNGLGAELRIDYAASTEFYLADKAAGNPWATKLPFPVHVVRRVERTDHIGRNTYVSLYSYHHGHFDGAEREWRGFGRVDQLDTEEFADASKVPPAEVRTWYHTGVAPPPSEYFGGPVLPESIVPLDGMRALKGRMLRREVYGRDESLLAARPYRVTEHNYTVKALQPNVFLVCERERAELHHERRDDPRIGHEVALEVDDFGGVLLSASVAYGRSVPDPDPRLSDTDRAVQATTLASFTSRKMTGVVDLPDAWRSPMLAASEKRTLDVASPTSLLFGFEELTTMAPTATEVVSAERILYRRNDLTAALPLQQLESLALAYESYRLALTGALVSEVYPPGQEAELAEGGLVQLDGDWWAPGGRVSYTPSPVDPPAAELSLAAQHFFRERRRLDPWGNATALDYDPHDLFVVDSSDPAGNVTGFIHNYRVLRPASVTDPNGNRRAAAFDTLGMVAGTAVMGKPAESLGDSLAGFTADLTEQQIATHFTDPRAGAQALLGRATTRYVYDLHAFARTGTDPVVVSTLSRELHESDPGGQVSPVRCGLSYSDGLGHVVQEKKEAEQGRWIASGWVIRSNKGSPVRKYEPFFDTDHRFVFGNTVGVTAITCYDPLERAVVVIAPSHSWRKVVFDAWGQEMWDGNDTVLIADPAADPDVGGYFAAQPGGNYLPTWYGARSSGQLGVAEQEAAAKAALHAATPTLVVVDPMGRTFLTVDSLTGGSHSRRLVLDIQGNQREVVDELGRTAWQARFDLLGKQIDGTGMDSGRRRTLRDAAGEPIREWDSRGHEFAYGYDALRRLVTRRVKGTDAENSDPRTLGKQVLYEKVIYGEGQPGDAAANLRGRVAAVSDGSGVDTTEAYDFKGNALHHTRRLTADHRALPDWSGSVALENEVWHNHSTFDALDRPVTLTTPEGSVTRVSYSERGLVLAVDVTTAGAESPVSHVTGITYNAKGQETEVVLGNGANVTYEYDPLTARPVRITTTRPAAGDTLATQLFVDATRVQDLRYTYDPSGNVTRLADEALKTVFFDNAAVEPVFQYRYDAAYRLIEATGREQEGQGLRGYKESYAHDPAGNLKSLTHNGSVQSLPIGPGNRLSGDDYTYDAHGCLTTTPQNPVLRWDFAGRLYASSKQAVSEGGEREMTYYSYSAGGQRVRKVTERPNQTRRYSRVYLRGSELYKEFGGDGMAVSLTRETLHVMAAARRVALVEGGNARYQLGNHLDSAILELDPSGGLITYEEYTPYGATAYQTGRSMAEVSLKRYRYTGRERDEETGFQYHGARYYVPWLARWSACDPAGLVDGPNMYAYARGNPVRMRDPSGTEAEEPKKKREYTSTPPAGRRETWLERTPGLHGKTKVQWHHWPGEQYDKESGKPKGDPTLLTFVVAGLWIGAMVALILLTKRDDRPGDPEAYKYIRTGFSIAVGVLVVGRLIMERTVSKTPEGEEPKWDKKFADPWWTTIHTSVGVLMGIWQVPFPIVALATIGWEGVEIAAPGFGDHEINGNRLTDIGVAWAGWLAAASVMSAWTKAPFPHGLTREHYWNDRGQS